MNYEAIFQNPIYSIFEQIDRSKGKPINVSQIALKVAGHVADIFDGYYENGHINFDGKSKEVIELAFKALNGIAKEISGNCIDLIPLMLNDDQ